MRPIEEVVSVLCPLNAPSDPQRLTLQEVGS